MRVYKFQSINPDIIKNAVSLWNDGLSAKQIAEIMGKSRPLICLYLKSAGVNMLSRRYSKYILNEEFFDVINTPEKAYWLGFLLADGHIMKGALSSELQSGDHEHLIKMARSFGSDAPIGKSSHKRNEKTYASSRCILCSKKLLNTLLDHGWDDFKKKGDCRILSIVPDVHLHDCLRGLFDGDGCLTRHKKDFHFTLTDAHESVVTWYRDVLVKNLGLRPIRIYPSTKSKSAFLLHYGGNIQMTKIMNYLKGEPCLERKWGSDSKFKVLSETKLRQFKA